jgi:uncharacterized Zn finger protein
MKQTPIAPEPVVRAGGSASREPGGGGDDRVRLTGSVAGFGQLDLWRLAGKRSYERGEGYVDAVTGLRDVRGGVVATVHGTEPYQVRLSWSTAGLTGECSCPFGEEGEFCKHCVAVGLLVIDAAEEDDEFDDEDDDDEFAEEDEAAVPGVAGRDGGEVRRYLASLDHAALVDLLCERAAHDENLDRMLRLRAARRTAPDLASLRE